MRHSVREAHGNGRLGRRSTPDLQRVIGDAFVFHTRSIRTKFDEVVRKVFPRDELAPMDYEHVPAIGEMFGRDLPEIGVRDFDARKDFRAFQGLVI